MDGEERPKKERDSAHSEGIKKLGDSSAGRVVEGAPDAGVALQSHNSHSSEANGLNQPKKEGNKSSVGGGLVDVAQWGASRRGIAADASVRPPEKRRKKKDKKERRSEGNAGVEDRSNPQ
jgi:hypothetical protein